MCFVCVLCVFVLYVCEIILSPLIHIGAALAYMGETSLHLGVFDHTPTPQEKFSPPRGIFQMERVSPHFFKLHFKDHVY